MIPATRGARSVRRPRFRRLRRTAQRWSCRDPCVETIVGAMLHVNGSSTSSHQLGLDQLDALPGAGAEAPGEGGGEEAEVGDETEHGAARAAVEGGDD